VQRSRPRRPETLKKSDATAALAQLLTRRPLTEREASDWLAGGGFAPDDAQAALAHAREAGWLDDAVFARLWIGDRLARHPLSRRAVAQELARRKLPSDLAQRALDELYPPDQEREVATTLAEARLARLATLDEPTRARRTTDFLLRRGFSAALATDCVRRALRGGGDG